MTSPNLRLLSVQEIAAHNGADDCWLLVEGQVWDLTQFAPDHPGGPEGELLIFELSFSPRPLNPSILLL